MSRSTGGGARGYRGPPPPGLKVTREQQAIEAERKRPEGLADFANWQFRIKLRKRAQTRGR